MVSISFLNEHFLQQWESLKLRVGIHYIFSKAMHPYCMEE